MKKIAKIDPELEFEKAKKIIDVIGEITLTDEQISSLDSSVGNLITVARVLIERENRRRGDSKSPPKDSKPNKGGNSNERDSFDKLPSKKYPNLEIVEEIIIPSTPPTCPCCLHQMKESGLFDVTEKLEVIPKKYFIQRNKRVKFNCPKCYGAMFNTPPVPSIIPSSNFGDSLVIDAALAKFCDLIPIERYAQMAYESGSMGVLAPHSLIGATHHLANFLKEVYAKIITEVLDSPVLHADETPHKMLEGDEVYHWYLWGFFSSKGAFLEAHNTRSGDVAFYNLARSKAEFLLTDGYAGYGKALRELSAIGKKIIESHCNSHAFRYFKDAGKTWKEECEPLLALYGQIYNLEDERMKAAPEEQLSFRTKMIPLFDQLKKLCTELSKVAMPSSYLMKAVNYFINHFDGLTVCTKFVIVPLDNNLAERELRAPVVGRKTWIGTHSKRGAETMSILFSIVRTCKMNNINPRNYFPWIVDRIHKGEEILTPYEYSKLAG